MLLSLFCGAGGLDLGFEQAGYDVGLAYDKKLDSVASYKRNRKFARAFAGDVGSLGLANFDSAYGGRFAPEGVIGGPPCQSFSQANVRQQDDDPRHELALAYARILKQLNERSPVSFFVFENVTGLTLARHKALLTKIRSAFETAGYELSEAVLNAHHFGTPQKRERLFIVGFNRDRYPGLAWTPPCQEPGTEALTVRHAIGLLPEPVRFRRGLTDIPHHPNHWCMVPKSPKFSRPGALTEGDVRSRSFKTLAWGKPSIAVAYGHREVHIHPSGTRRLSVHEAMKLQGFPDSYVLLGNMSSQITQVSDAVPPPLAQAVAESVNAQLAKAGLAEQTETKRTRVVA